MSCFRNLSKLHVSFSSAVVETRTRDLYEAICPCLQVHTMASLYLYDKFHYSSDVKVCQCLRSASTSWLVRRARCLTNFRRSSFSGCCFLRLWNTLPQNVMSAQSLTGLQETTENSSPQAFLLLTPVVPAQ